MSYVIRVRDLVVTATKFWKGHLLRVPEYRVMRFSDGKRVKCVEHIACM